MWDSNKCSILFFNKGYIFSLILKYLANSFLNSTEWRRSGVFIVNFEHISHFFSTIDFEQAS